MKFDNLGNLVSKFKLPSSYSGVDYSFGQISGLSFDGRYLWYLDTLRKTVYPIFYSIPEENYSPKGVTNDGDYLWTFDLENNDVFEIDSTGNIISFFHFQPHISVIKPNKLIDIVFGKKDLWILEGYAKISQVNINGIVIDSFYAPVSNPTGLAYGWPYLWVSSNNGEICRLRIDWP